MNLDAVVIVLREVLEAALLASLLLALAHRMQLGRTWLWLAIVIGTLGAWFYAGAISWISELWDYTGQEVVNTSMQLGIFFAFVTLLVNLRKPTPSHRLLVISMAIIIVLALTRELSEILLYLQSYSANEDMAASVFAGAAVGFITGSCVGIIVYVITLWVVDWSFARRAILWTLAAVVAGILMQVVSLLLQIDRLPHLPPLWNSSDILSERSILGQLLYALLGYEATPTAWHLGAYVLSLIVMLALIQKRYLRN